MTRTKLIQVHPLIFPLSDLPDTLQENEIIIISGGVRVLTGRSLSQSERYRADEMTSPEVRDCFLAARRILRFSLSKWMSVDPLDLEIIPDENGKPYLVTENPIHFSITHSSDQVAVAFSRKRVGLDLESFREVDASALAARFFTPDEADWIDHSDDANLFFRLWCSREAAIKADGRGLSKLLSITSVTRVGEGNHGSLEVRIGDERWEALHWTRDGIHGALAFQKRPPLISWCDLS
jgi:4'-phosphopantetheinyl transferase